MKTLFIISILLLTVLLTVTDNIKAQAALTPVLVTSDPALAQPVLALTWDDDAVDEWYSIKDTLKYYGVKCTFFVCRFTSLSKEKIEKLQILQSEGHEIGCHSYSHADAVKYVNNFGIYKYVHDEITSEIDSMKKYGLHPTSFAYPQGINNSALDRELQKYFTILRGTTYYPAPDFKNPPVVNGLGIDENYSPVDYLLTELERDYAKGQFVVFYGHTPVYSYENIPKYHTSVRRLAQILKKAKSLGYHFVTMSELNVQRAAFNVRR